MQEKRILFIGDSITDCSRDKSDPANLGKGYVALLQQRIDDLCINRGISGNRVCDVQQRFAAAVAETQPDHITVYVGINDVVHLFKRFIPQTEEQFAAEYAELVKTAMAADRPLRVIAPFLLPATGLEQPEPWRPLPGEMYKKWRAALDPRLAITKEQCQNNAIPLLELDPLFHAAAQQQPPATLTLDGVHPTPAGHQIIADALLAFLAQ